VAAACSSANEPAPEPVPSPSPAVVPASPSWQVTADGAGPLRLDMTLLEAQQALGEQPSEPGSAECEQRRLRGVGGSVLAMFVNHRLARIDVTEETVATDAGVRVGTTAPQVRERYGDRVVATPHKYTDGQYLTVTVAGDRRLVFETDGAEVTRYRVGRLPEVEWVEGCS
jgi:hypothetical protein